MKLDKRQIVEELKRIDPGVHFNDFKNTDYTIASLFAPINNGFYFYTGIDHFPFDIKDSLILVSHGFQCANENNTFIYLSEGHNPQRVYYQLLDHLFGRKSKNEISALSQIDNGAQLGLNVEIGPFCDIESDVKIGNNVIIGSHVKIHRNTVIEDSVIIESGSIIGTQGMAWIWDETQTNKIVQPQLGGVIIKSGCILGAQTVIVRGSLSENSEIGSHTFLAPGCRLGHGTIIGDYCHFANNVTTGGNTTIGNYCFVGSAAIFRPKVKLHQRTIVGAGALVIKNTTAPSKTLIGLPAKETETSAAPSGMPQPKKK